MNLVKKQSLRPYILTATICGFLAVAIGAFGAHALKQIIGPERLPIFETGSKYHFYHTIVSLILISIANGSGLNSYLKYSFWIFMIGIFLFSFSLYALAITGIKIWGIITPFGGMCFLIAWVLLGFGLNQSFAVPKKN